MYKWADQTYLMHSYRQMFAPDNDQLPAEFPSTREINIQIAKWERLLEERGHSIVVTVKVPARGLKQLKAKKLTKKQLRDEGRLTAQCMQHGRNVQDLIIETLRQYMNAQLAKEGRKITRQSFAQFRRKFEAAMLEYRRGFFKYACEQKFFEKSEKQALLRLASPLKQLNAI